MIIDLPKTSTVAVSKKLVALRNDVGAMTLGRVLTLIIVVEDHEAEEIIEAANDASRQHPCRIIVVVAANRRGATRLDAQIRLGGDAGASEIIVMRLYGTLASHEQSVVVPLLLADSPVVAWWPREAPVDMRVDPIAQMVQRRITDAAESRNPKAMLKRLADHYQPGDTDLAWTRITRWRGLLAAALDGPPYEVVTEAVVAGALDSPSSELLAAWLGVTLKVPVRRVRTAAGTGVVSVRLSRSSGHIDLVRPDGTIATLSQPGQPDRRISLKRRGLAECLADELRRLDDDDTYSRTLTKGLQTLKTVRLTASEAAARGQAPSTKQARRLAAKLGRSPLSKEAAEMVTAKPPPDRGDTVAVKKATARKVAGAPTERERVVGRRATTKSARAAVKQAEAEDTAAKGRRPSRAPGA
ncbi:glucose-6-phosphate dehydrogenase assembly protein OpcA [Lapillicoccus sp.]|uniref:glucose-6-phosphate dehydrogenase assembly protein OpcA n=1 Tax=Lapillicoccus sp. TaxID=1909287 RepID=UPI0032643E7D